MFSSESPSKRTPTSDLPEILQKVEANWPVLPSGMWNSSSVRSLSRHLQQLSRRSEQLGQTALHDLVTAIDEQINEIIDSNALPESVQIDTLNDSLQRLMHIVDGLERPDKTQSADMESIDLIYLPRSQDESGAIERAATSNHWQYRSIANLQELSDALSGEGAKTVLIDTQFLPELSLNLEILRAGKRARPGLFFISDHFDIETRLQAMRAGATQLFSKPIDIDALIAALGECISPQAKPHHRVLIVEDDESQATFAANLLHRGKLETLAITDPLGVINAVRRFQPDLILMDLYMPGADGIELTRLIREREESETIPIVFLSGEDDLEKKLLALQAGADDFLNKPVRPQQLLATVKTRIERARSITAAAMRDSHARTSDLHNRRELLSQLGLMRAEFKMGQQFHALIVICLNDQQSDPEQWEGESADQRMEQAMAALKPLLQEKDYLANIGNQSLAILFKRPAEQEVERLGELAYSTVSQRLKEFPGQTRFGVGLTLLDGTTESAFELLCHGESSAASAYQQGIEGYELYGEAPQADEEETSDPQPQPLQQFLLELRNGSVAIGEQAFACRHGHAGGVETYELAPQLASPVHMGNPYQAAEQYGAAGEFDRFICERAIERLGRFALQGKRVRLLFRQSASVIQDADYLEFIKSALRKHQIVGTGLMVDFDLPSLASDLKRARALIGELAALGIGVSLSNFACNETAYKVLAYLQAEAVRPHLSLLRIDAQKIQHITSQIHSLRAEIILPIVQRHGQIALQWSDSADYVQADFAQ